MLKFSRKIAFIVVMLSMVIVTFAPMNAPSEVQAQTDTTLARIDDAMAHLSGYLGRTITRQSNFWQWSQNVYPNEAMGCGVPGAEYPANEIRAYRVRITVDEVVYDYRVNTEGSIIILCIDGEPDPSSIGLGPILGEPPSLEGTLVNLPTGTDWTWWYDGAADLLYLINAGGVQAQLPRPKLPNEVPTSSFGVGVAFSRDGSVLVIQAELNNGNQGIGIYDIETATMLATHEAQPDELVFLGGTAGSRGLTSNQSSTQIAVGFAPGTIPPGGIASPPIWRIIIFNLVTGGVDDILESTSPEFTGIFPSMPPAYDFVQNGIPFPFIQYFDNTAGGILYFQMQMGFTEGTPTPPTFAWIPTTNTVIIADQFSGFMDFNPTTDRIAASFVDPGYALLPPEGPFTSYNAIGTGTDMTDISNVFVDGTSWQFGAEWAASGQSVLYYRDDSLTDGNHSVVNIAERASFRYPTEIKDLVGTPLGWWSISDTTLSLHRRTAPLTGTPVYSGDLSDWRIAWQELPVSGFGLTSLIIPEDDGSSGGVVPPAGDGVCPGAPPSQVAVGVRARVTLSDTTPLPLRVRTAPGGEFITNMEEGTEFDIIGGPSCQGGFTWWQVRTPESIVGWSAEGDPTQYYMEPAP